MAHREWQSFPIEFREFPSLQASAAAGNRQRRRGNRHTVLPVQNVAPHRAHPPNFWNNRKPSSKPEWGEDEVNAANQSAADASSFSAAIAVVVPEPELRSVEPKFLDWITARSRFDPTGYGVLAEVLTKQMLSRTADPTAPFRALVLECPIAEFDPKTAVFLRQPDPSATPNWRASLPDRILNDEYRLISYVRSLALPLGPTVLEALLRTCPYNAMERRKLPIYKSDPVPAPVTTTQKPRKSLSQVSQQSDRSTAVWQGPSNDVRLSGRSQGLMEFRNSKYKESNRRGCTDSRDTRYNNGDADRAASRSDYNHEWDECYEHPKSNRYNNKAGYGRKDESYRSEDRGERGDYDYREDSGYHDQGEYESGDWGSERWESGSGTTTTTSPPAEPVERVATEYSKNTPDWRTEWEGKEKGDRRGGGRKPPKWRGKWTTDRPQMEEERESSRGEEGKEKEKGDEQREEDPDARHYWKFAGVSPTVRRAFRCLEGVAADSCTALADDMHRVELSTWSGDEDAAAVTARMREKHGLEEMEREAEQRRVHLALPRTTITLAVGAGGEAVILFDGDCTEVLVRGRSYPEIQPIITQKVVKSRDFNSTDANRHTPAFPHERENTVLSMASVEESREVRELLRGAGIDAKKIPRDLITGHWDGTYAQRECLIELKWDRFGVHGFNVRLHNLAEQNNLVDRLMRTKSEFFMSAHVNIEEIFNRMYVAVPASPFPVDDDMRFLKDLLEENGVAVASIAPCRSRDGPQTIDTREKQANCRLAINRRILKVAIEQGVWGGFHPRNQQEWRMMLEESRFSWSVDIHPEEELHKNGANSATVVFDSYEQGERIAAQVQRMTPCPSGEDRFILNKEDRKGVFARAKLRVHYNVPVIAHALCRQRLKRLDDTWRFQSHFSHADLQTEREPLVQWACLISDDETATPPGYCRLVVEGFPKSMVEDCCTQLVDVIRGDVIKCEGYDEWLLTGMGRSMADAIAKDALEMKKVLVDFNVLGKEIRLIGEREDTADVKERLKKIVMRSDLHVMQTRVSLRQPVYMNRTSEAILARGGIPMMERVIGECRITGCPEDADKRTIRFEGTVAAFDRFRDFLGDLDDTLRESAKAEYEKQRKRDATLPDPSLSPLTSALICPICCCRPSADFYRLEACGHVYCTQCIYHQLNSELSTRTLPLKCSREGCGRKLAVSDLLRLLLGRDPEAAPTAAAPAADHLDEMKLRPLVTAIVTNALQTQRDKLIACRTADCAGIFPRLAEANSLVRCKSCERTTCGACGYEPHRGYECDEYEKIRDNVDVSIASYMKNKKVRKCPNARCSAVIEKTVGCNHMECVICRTHFCWLCGYASSTQGEIYSHMQNDHGGNGLHMDDGEMFMLQFDD